MRRVLDVENSITLRDGKIHNDPFEPSNTLTQVGVLCLDTQQQSLLCFDHQEKNNSEDNKCKLQRWLDSTTLLIGHNLQYDLSWLWASGFTYDGDIYDTMLAEYLLLRGQKEPLSLEQCAQRRQLEYQKDDTLKSYYKKGYNTNEIPLDELSYYLSCDLLSTGELYKSIEKDYQDPASTSLYNVRDITFRTCKSLARMYMRGFRVDTTALKHVRDEFQRERNEIEDRLQEQVRTLMGGTPINLNSPEQLSQVFFSRRIHNKKEWADLFEFAGTLKNFQDIVEKNSDLILKTYAVTCPTCKGKGKTYKVRKDGTKYAKPNKCKDCDARGYQLRELREVAGLQFRAPNKSWISANGFSTGKDKLDVLIANAKTKGMKDAERFITDVKRLSAISSYLSSFVDGISTYTKKDGLLHVGLTQHITSTGRFSGRNPNMQNMPRGGTFPVKRVFISRWADGHILEADFAQLEFRTAAFLAQDDTAMQEIDTGFDVHSYTAKVISDAGQPTTRQEAKAHTFAPLFGATSYGRSKAEGAYYEHFVEKYKGIARWHKELGNEALRFQKITNVSGRQYAFPDVTRRANGSVSHFTRIKNYPVQGFATGDVVPLVLIELDARLEKLHSGIVNSVHDSVVVDVHPSEKEYVVEMIDTLNEDLNSIVEEAYGIKINVPLLLEAKIGKNWLDIKDV
tara:strand:- start:9158 stop:11200 length:2043 start_codon:yes stop_codon:yes gene_type:complete